MTENFKCHFCDECKGFGCVGEMPGMGGPNESRNFILNCSAWKEIEKGPFSTENCGALVRLAPMTGAEENVGYGDEKQFYLDMIGQCVKYNVPVTIGDGTPDFKLQWGIEAVRENQKIDSDLKATVFVKPYPNEKIMERFTWAEGIMECGGIDIDSYNIITMRNLVHLEKKDAQQLLQIKKYLASKGVPFAIKGIFNEEDIDLVKQVKPDVAVISNHGGRVDVRAGSTAAFLAENYKVLKENAGELWVDGGIRSKADYEKACSYGVDSVMLGRPFVTALCSGKSFENILR